MAGLTIAATDPVLARAAFKAKRTAPERARVADEIMTLLAKWNGGQSGVTRNDLRDEVVNRRQDLNQKLVEGRAGFPLDPGDDAAYALTALNTIGTALPYFLTPAGPEGTAAGVVSRQFLKDFASVGKELVSLPATQDWLRDLRARRGADASAE